MIVLLELISIQRRGYKTSINHNLSLLEAGNGHCRQDYEERYWIQPTHTVKQSIVANLYTLSQYLLYKSRYKLKEK